MNYPHKAVPASSQNHATPYDRAQGAVIGSSPMPETLQVDGSIGELGEAVDFCIENVQMLLRRLQPVTGDFAVPVGEDNTLSGSWKVPLSQRIDLRRDQLADLTTAVQCAIRALQV